jgi:hypothetical protein
MNLKQGNLPRPPVDPLDDALTELKRLPEAERFSKGQSFLRTIIEETLKRPHLSGAVETAAMLCGKTMIEAIDLRAEVERAAMKSETPPVRSDVVRVLTDPDTILRMRESSPKVISEYNPFGDYWMGRRRE